MSHSWISLLVFVAAYSLFVILPNRRSAARPDRGPGVAGSVLRENRLECDGAVFLEP